MLSGGGVNLSAQTCDPPTAVSVSSITSTTATVNWTPYGGASFTWVHYKVQGAGSESTVSVAGSSYMLTGLSPCTTYEVRLRSACGSIVTSAYTSTEQFKTATSNPTVEISVEMLDNGCTAVIGATEGFVSYIWTKTGVSGADTLDNDTTGLLIKSPGEYNVLATDANGCTATDALTIPYYMFTSGCITDEHNELIRDSVEAKAVQRTSDINLLAKALTALSANSTIKSIVKSLALSDPNYHVKISDLSAECTANSINLKNEVKTALWNNGGSASDTARVALIMNGFTYNFPGGTPTTNFYPSIYFHHLDPENIGDVSGAWDTLTPTYVVPTVGNRTSPYSVRYLSGGSVATTTISKTTLLETPHWQVLINTLFPNDSGNDETDGPTARCSCSTLHVAGVWISSCGTASVGGCSGSCSGRCNGWQRLKSAIATF